MPDEQEYLAFIKKLLANPKKGEALAWLKASSDVCFRNLGELGTTAESVAFVQRLYDLGAKDVTAVEINEYATGQNTGKLVVDLPDDPVQRSQLFHWVAQQAESRGFEADDDFGQSYLFVWLD